MKEQLAKVQAEIEDEQKRLQEVEKKQHQAKVRLIGAYVLNRSLQLGTLDKLVAEMDQAGVLTKPADRKLFGLNGKPKDGPKTPG